MSEHQDGAVGLAVAGDGVAEIRFNRPGKANAMDRAAAEAFAAAARAAADARVVVIRAEGKFFSAGGDLASFAAAPDGTAAAIRATAGALHEGLRTLAAIDAPVIAEVGGVAAGAGLSIVAACDLVVAARDAGFVFGYTAAGLSPDAGASYSLARLLGPRRAFELAVSNRRLGAEEAHALGLVTHLVDHEELRAFTTGLAEQLAAGPTGAYGALKRLLAAAVTSTFDAQLDLELETIAERAETPEGREGIDAFLGKRTPDFRAATGS